MMHRSRSTQQELKGIALQNLLLKKMGRKSEDMAIERVSLKDLHGKTIRSLIVKAIEKERIPSASIAITTELL